MKSISFFLSLLLSMSTVSCFAADGNGMEHAMHHNNAQHGQILGITDSRTSLNLTPEMKRHQLANMRSHVEAVQTIVGMLSRGEFDLAAQVAHSRLGLTAEMKQMCSMFGNDKYNELGLAFHRSGDELSNALQLKDMNKSLQALNTTMEYCVQCHATFRQ